MPKKVVNWFDNGKTDKFLQITVAKPAKNGRAQLACTPNHLIRTPSGWREAGELKVGDRVLEALPHYLSDFQWEALRGTLMGDGALSPTRSGHGARFRYCHGAKQTAYADWKASLFSNCGDAAATSGQDGVVTCDFSRLPELAPLRHEVYAEKEEGLRRRLPEAPDAVVAWPSGTWTTATSPSVRRDVQKRTAGLTGRAENLRRGHGAGHPGAAGGVPGRHLGDQRPS